MILLIDKLLKTPGEPHGNFTGMNFQQGDPRPVLFVLFTLFGFCNTNFRRNMLISFDQNEQNKTHGFASLTGPTRFTRFHSDKAER